MRNVYEIGFWVCLAIGMGLAVWALVRRKPGEYLDDPKHRPLLIATMAFVILGIVLAFLMANTPATSAAMTFSVIR